MANRFLNNIRINDAYTFPASDGTNGQVITTDGNGNLTFEDVTASGAVNSKYVYYEVKNSSGSTINKGTAVRAVGTDGNSGHILIAPMVADGSVEPKYFMGVLASTLDNGDIGEVIHFGELDQIDTSTYQDGDVLWCDPANDGDFTTTEPLGPNLKIAAAIVINASTNGKIKVRVQGNEGLHELHDVKITTQVDGELLIWDNTLGVWKNDGTLTVDYTNDRIGIGTTSPSEKLTINGGYVKIIDNAYDAYFLSKERTDGTQLVGFQSHSLGALSIHANGGEKMRIDRDGNVGIGEASPDNRIHIKGSTDATSSIKLEKSGSSIALLTSYYIGTFTNDDFRFFTNSSEKMRIDASGNLGIGTSSPASLLHIYDSSNAEIKLETSAGSALLRAISDTLVYRGDSHIFQAEGGTERMRIDSSGDVTINGGSLFLPNNEYYYSKVSGGSNIRMLGINASNVAYIGAIEAGVVSSIINASSTSTTLSLYTSGSEKMRIDSSGNLGIGTSSPSAKIHVNSATTDSVAIFESSDATAKLHLKDDSTSNIYSVGIGAVGNDLTFYAAAGGNERMRIDSAGNVGIGTTTPAVPLHVNGFARINGSLQLDGSDRQVIAINNTSLRFGTNNTERMRIDASGSVGIGTTTPGATLDVNGAIVSRGGTYDAGTDTKTNTGLVIQEGDFIATQDGSYLRNLIGKTTGDVIEIGQSGTSLIDSINLLPGTGGNSAVNINGNTVWNAGNDGAGSGLDADLLDGYDWDNTPDITIGGILLEDSSDRSGLLEINKKGTSAWTGIQINHGATLWSFMSNASNVGVYDDTNSKWAWLAQPNAGIELLFNGAKQAETENGYFLATNQMRSPIYYDSDNTDYYGNFSGDSRINRIFYSKLESPNSSNNARFENHTSWGTLHQTDNGYIQIGPANANYAHIYTDRPTFYFNKELLVNNNTVWNAGNDGSGSGLDADLLDGIDSSYFVYGQNANKTTNVSNVNTALASGFYDGNSATGSPTSTWYTYINSRHNNTANNYGSQIACSFYDTQNFYVRNVANGVYGSWAKIWNSSNDGSGSGLDADLLDGLDSTQFLRSDASDAISGNLTVNGNIYVNEFIYHNGDTNTYLRLRGDDAQLVAGARNVIRLDEGADPDKIQLGDSATYTYTDGSLGVGTSTPAQKLTVNGDASASTFYDYNDTAKYLNPGGLSSLSRISVDGIREPVTVTSNNTNATVGTIYVLTASLTLTLPSSPITGERIKISNRSGTTTCVVARNGNNIMGLAENLTLDVENIGITLVYSGNATQGWVII